MSAASIDLKTLLADFVEGRLRLPSQVRLTGLLFGSEGSCHLEDPFDPSDMTDEELAQLPAAPSALLPLEFVEYLQSKVPNLVGGGAWLVGNGEISGVLGPPNEELEFTFLSIQNLVVRIEAMGRVYHFGSGRLTTDEIRESFGEACS